MKHKIIVDEFEMIVKLLRNIEILHVPSFGRAPPTAAEVFRVADFVPLLSETDKIPRKTFGKTKTNYSVYGPRCIGILKAYLFHRAIVIHEESAKTFVTFLVNFKRSKNFFLSCSRYSHWLYTSSQNG